MTPGSTPQPHRTSRSCWWHPWRMLAPQVHAATLKSSGTEVVVKVVKPGVRDTLNTDLSFIYLSARLLEILQPDLSRTSLVSPRPIPS